MEALYSPSVQLPALAQLMKLRRAGVETCAKHRVAVTELTQRDENVTGQVISNVTRCLPSFAIV